MRFHKAKPSSARRDGTRRVSDGRMAVLTTEALASDVLLVQGQDDRSDVRAVLRSADVPPVEIKTLDPGRAIVAVAAGYAESGMRASGFVNELANAHETLRDASGKHLAFVLHLASRAARRHAGSLYGSHDDYHSIAESGLVQMFASNVQEAVDFAIILRRIAEQSLTPAVCAHDVYDTGQSVQSFEPVEREIAMAYLGHPADTIPSPTPAQDIVFGAERRRIPRLIDPDYPAGIGGVQDAAYFRAVAGQHAFFYDHVRAIATQAMAEFASLVGRSYHMATPYRVDDAEFVVVAQGTVLEELRAVVDYLRDKEHVRAGLVSIHMYRPFPGDEVSVLLKGKKAVTVIERTDQPMTDEPPLTREIRSSLDKAMENGSAGKRYTVHPGYETYRESDRPQLCSGTYGVGGGTPEFKELVAVFRNMSTVSGSKKHPPQSMRRRFFVGAVFDPPNRRFPHLQMLGQRIARQYPELESLSLPAASDVTPPVANGKTVRLHFLSGQGGLFAGKVFAQAWCELSDQQTKTFADGGLDPMWRPASVTMSFADRDVPIHRPERADVVLVSSSDLLKQAVHTARPGGVLIVACAENPSATWARMPQQVVDDIASLDLTVHVVDSRHVVSQTGGPSAADQLAVVALLGACARIGLGIDDSELEQLAAAVAGRLAESSGEFFPTERIADALRLGARDAAELDWRSLPENPGRGDEPVPPWTIDRAATQAGTVFDVTRFWHSVGYLYDVGDSDQTLTDPYMATGMIPARSSAFRDMTATRLRVPEWLPENCSGCGSCWALCPESALPPGIYDLVSIVSSACEICEHDGVTMTQMRRISEPLAKQAYRLVLDDGPAAYRTLGPLLQEAFTRLVAKMGLEGDKLETLQTEYQSLSERIGEFQFARTESFFDAAHQDKKGGGRLLSLTLNPLSCTGCGICVAVCPEDALGWGEQTRGTLERLDKNWRLQKRFGSASDEVIARHVVAGTPETQVNRLLARAAYHSMVGGDGTAPGSTAKIALHLVAGSVESVMRPRFAKHIDRLTTLIDQTEAAIQGRVSDTVRINDFEQFGERLTRLEHTALTAAELHDVAFRDDAVGLDPEQLALLTRLLADIKRQRTAYVKGASGYGRARMVMAIDASATSSWAGTYPYNPLAQPWAIHPVDDAPAVAIGLFEGLANHLAEEIKTIRRLELELDGRYVPTEHDAYFARFGWNDFDDEEKTLIPVVLLLVDEHSAMDRVMETVLDSGFPIKVMAINRSGLRVDGANRIAASGADLVALQRGDVFVLQTSTGHPGHLMEGASEGVSECKPAIFHIFAPDVQTSGVAVDQTVRHAEDAYKSRLFPLFKFVPGRPVTLDGNPDRDKPWVSQVLKMQEPSGAESSIDRPLTPADWAVRDIRFRGLFRFLGKGHRTGQLKPLIEFCELTESERGSYEPYLDVVDDRGQHGIALVPPTWVAVTEQTRDVWRRLRTMAEKKAETSPEISSESPRQPSQPQTVAVDESPYRRLTERLLTLAGYNDDPEFFKRSMRDFLMRGRQDDSPE